MRKSVENFTFTKNKVNLELNITFFTYICIVELS